MSIYCLLLFLLVLTVFRSIDRRASGSLQKLGEVLADLLAKVLTEMLNFSGSDRGSVGGRALLSRKNGGLKISGVASVQI
jgi:hypothetical protein